MYFYLISKLGNNNFLPAITIFLTYGSMLWVIWRFANFYKISKLYLFIGTFFLLSTYWYYDTCSGIRNGLAFAVAIFCLYFDLVEKKKIFCIGYLVALGIHSAAVIFLGLRLLTEVNMRLKRKHSTSYHLSEYSLVHISLSSWERYLTTVFSVYFWKNGYKQEQNDRHLPGNNDCQLDFAFSGNNYVRLYEPPNKQRWY